ncbi:maleylacetoacetate isomerase [Betaproteobacteria bacterium GR16-43]|nr:maleylacetoacetate isomerase [Betaproteobacteria bacterium GR16-43]
MTMILHDYFRSSASFRVRIAVNLKGLSPERRSVHLVKGEQRSADYLAINPQGFVPMLTIGDRRFTQSLAIIEYLDETYPQPPLLPKTAEERAWVRSVALAIACDIHPLNNTRVLAHLKHALATSQETRDDWYRHWITEGFNAIETQLAGRATGRFCLGDTPTLADICLVPQVFNSQRLHMALAPWPRISSIHAACLAVPAFADAVPAKQPDAE